MVSGSAQIQNRPYQSINRDVIAQVSEANNEHVNDAVGVEKTPLRIHEK